MHLSPRVALALITILTLGLAPTRIADHRLDSTRSQQNHLPTVNQVIERFIKAIGGRTAWLKVKTQYAAGTIEVPAIGNKGTYEVYSKAPTKSLAIIRFPSGEFRYGFDGQKSWRQTHQGVAQYEPPEKQAASRRDSDFYKYLNFNQHFPDARVKGVEDVDGEKAYIVEAIPAGEKLPELLYFNIKTGILVRRDTSSVDNKGKNTTDIQFYDDYREVDGIKVAFSQRIIQGGVTILSKHTEVKNNVTIDDAMFNLPARN